MPQKALVEYDQWHPEMFTSATRPRFVFPLGSRSPGTLVETLSTCLSGQVEAEEEVVVVEVLQRQDPWRAHGELRLGIRRRET